MTTKAIGELPIKQITADDAVCFMWVADAFIPDAIEVMKAWGFTYKTLAFIWCKTELSGKQTCYMGQWTMKNCEIVLLGTKGTMTKYLISRKVRQLQYAFRDRTTHSRKPEDIRQRIMDMFGDLPRIELFARQKAEGWDCWGNEVDSDITLEVQ
jgi:site-specific DNA-methyltransferase (adenine-specific)